MSRFSPDADRVLRRAGWYPNRQADTSVWTTALSGFTWHDAAADFLQEFGGIRVDIEGPGITCSREPFEIDPELAMGEEERFSELSYKYDRTFAPLGETGQGEFFLGIDEDGVIYLLASEVFRLGDSDSALESLIAGISAERFPAPGH